jgi:hypothetical protein
MIIYDRKPNYDFGVSVELRMNFAGVDGKTAPDGARPDVLNPARWHCFSGQLRTDTLAHAPVRDNPLGGIDTNWIKTGLLLTGARTPVASIRQ